MQETPSIMSSCYGSNTMQLGSLVDLGQNQIWNQRVEDALGLRHFQQHQETKTPMPNTTSRRYVQVFIADPNDNVPLEESVLFKGEQKLTDLTDTELFFEVPIAETLKSHNEKRVKWLDKEASKKSGKDVTLDPVKIRDLKMVVVTVAQF